LRRPYSTTTLLAPSSAPSGSLATAAVPPHCLQLQRLSGSGNYRRCMLWSEVGLWVFGSVLVAAFPGCNTSGSRCVISLPGHRCQFVGVYGSGVIPSNMLSVRTGARNFIQKLHCWESTVKAITTRDMQGQKLWITFNGFNMKIWASLLRLNKNYETMFSRGTPGRWKPGFWRWSKHESGKRLIEVTPYIAWNCVLFRHMNLTGGRYF
jgi:hypothetical protein